MKNWWLLLVGLFAGLWLSERERRLDIGRKAVGVQTKTESVASRKSRKLEELAPLYKTMAQKYAGDEELYEDHNKAWIAYVRQAIQPNLTELEAAEVAQSILEFQAPAYNYNEPLFPSWEKEEPDEPPNPSDAKN